MVLGKKVTIIDWEWGRNLSPRDEQKIPWQAIRKMSCVKRANMLCFN